MKKLRSLKLAALILVAVSFFSCKSIPDFEPVEPIELLDGDAAVYMSIPVQANRDFVNRAISRIGRIAEADAEKVSQRLEVAYISIDAEGALQLSASCDIPTTFLGFVLTEKNGWKKSETEGVPFYTHTLTAYQLCVPSNENLFLSKDIKDALCRFNILSRPDLYVADGNKRVKSFDELLREKGYAFLHENNSPDIKLYSPDPSYLINAFFGPVGIKSTVSSVYAVLSQYKGVKNQFNATLILNLSDSRTVKATIGLLKIGLFGLPVRITATGERQITITDFPISSDKMLSFIR
ncbi:MAG: hypothetical protein IJ727_10940 [Treponema sp.]|nr:hypothetical protein [Treponema sp.]